MRRGLFLPIVATLGFAFLYAPIVSLVVFSFNDSRLVTVWGGFSTRWYGELFSDGQMLAAAWISLKVATVAASLATVIGTLAGALLLAELQQGLALLSPGPHVQQLFLGAVTIGAVALDLGLTHLRKRRAA